MKLADIRGTLNIRTVTCSLNNIFFSWDNIEQKDSDVKVIFPENVKSYEEYKIFLCSLEDENKILVNAHFDNFHDGKIVITAWKKVIEIYNRNFENKDAFFLLQMKKGKKSYSYILCEKNNREGDFEHITTVAMARKIGLSRKSMCEYQDVLTVCSNRHVSVDNDDAIKLTWDSLLVKEVKCIDNGFRVALADKSEIYSNKIDDYVCVLLNEDTGDAYYLAVDYDISKREIIFDNYLNSVLEQVYEKGGKVHKICVYLFYQKEGVYKYFELKSEQNLGRKSQYNKTQYFQCCSKLIQEVEPSLATWAYYTDDSRLHFMMKKHWESFSIQCNAKMKSVKFVANKIRIEFYLDKTEYQIKSVFLMLRSKIQDKIYPFVLEIKDRGKGYKVVGELPIENVQWEQFYWDIRGIVVKDDEEFELRLKNYSIVKRLQLLLAYRQKFFCDGKYVLFPYLTKSKDFSIMYRMRSKQDSFLFVLKEYLALFLFYALYPYWKKKHLWLVYEKYSITAQDNSYYFFKYCMEKLDAEERKKIFYVIDKKSSDYQYVEQFGKKVIQFLSLKHMIYLKAADLLISSDTKAHAYAWHSPNSIYREMIKYKRNVFLQHGVIYYKQCHQGLRKNGTNGCKLFIVSSEVEKQIIKQYFGYKEDEIAVTGLARWDVLEDKSVPNEKIILMMPTWRNWLEEVTEEEFRRSDYYKNYTQLLNNHYLHTFLEEQNVKLIFYIHPKFREYIGAFSATSEHIEFIEFGSLPLNELIMRCNMMVTDYSSACWDVYYQEKPVLFYLFDYELYNEVQGSYVDMRIDAFGEATDNMETLVELMKHYTENGFQEKLCYADMRENLLPYRDELNSKRTFEIIKKKFSNS